MRLAAVTTGFGVAEPPFAAEVHSVFARAAILRVGASLVSLLPEAAGAMPGAITVGLPPDARFQGVLQSREAVAARAGVLRFAASGVTFDLRAARPWRSHLAEHRVDFTTPATASAWRTAAGALRAHGGSAAIAALARPAILALVAAARARDAGSAAAAAARLVGLGAGGTPAGDDLLVGFLTALWTPGGEPAGLHDFRTAFAAQVVHLAERTTEVSRVYLAAAAAGEVSQRLDDMVAAIADGAPSERVREVTGAAVAVGHTSGADGLLGLLVGLAGRAPLPLLAEARALAGS